MEQITIVKTFKYKVIVDKFVEQYFMQTMGCRRKVYNLYTDYLYEQLEMLSYQPGDEIPKITLPEVTVFKKEYDYLNDVDSLALANAKMDFEKSVTKYNNEFDHETYTKRALRRAESGTEPLSFRGLRGMPKFKSKARGDYTFTTNNQLMRSGNYTIRLEKNMLHIPKLKKDIPLVMHRPLPEDAHIKTVTITRDTDGTFYASITCEITVSIDNTLKIAAINNDSSISDRLSFIGLDYSQKFFYVDSNGKKANYPKYYRKAEERLAAEQRKLSRMVKGSNNYNKQKLKVAKLHRKVRNQRLDFINNLVHYLVLTYDVVVVEDIDLRAMSQCLRLAKNLYDNGFGIFRVKLLQKLEEKGSVLVKVDRWYASTKTCHCCGYKNKEVTLGVEEWTCPNCGQHHDRDENAAINIMENGKAIFLEYFAKHLEEKEKSEVTKRKLKKARINARHAA